MKLIIDIDEEYYEFIKGYDDVTLSKINQDLYKSVSNGTSLEDIKAEIKGEMNNPVELAKNRALYWVLEILDKHIKENKQ